MKTEDKYPLKELTRKTIAAAIEVHSQLGPGLLENIYEEALAHEFNLRGIKYEKQKIIDLKYKGKPIGNHRIDFLIENSVILELKAVSNIINLHEAQLLTYLIATKKKVGLIINFNVEKLKEGLKR